MSLDLGFHFGLGFGRARTYHALDTFTDPNDTQLVAHISDVGNINWQSGSTTWTIQSNAASNNPGVTGSNLVDAAASVFTAGTYSWVAQGTNTIANDANSLKITYGNNANGAKLLLSDAADLTTDLIPGVVYDLTFDAKVGAGDSVQVQIVRSAGNNPRITITETDFTSKTIRFVASHATADAILMRNMGAGEDIWLDNIVLKEVTLNQLFASDDLGITQGIFDIDLTLSSIGGLVVALDSESSPDNFIRIAYDNTGGVAQIEVWKVVAGTYTKLILEPATYSAGATLRVELTKSGSDLLVDATYNGNTIGTQQTISDVGIVGNARHGIMSVDTSNSLDNFKVNP